MRWDFAAIEAAIERRRIDRPVLLHTGEIIAEMQSVFLSDLDTPVRDSDNAEIGRMLKRHAKSLKIQQVAAHHRISDSHGHPTHASYWRLEPRPSNVGQAHRPIS